LRIADYFLRNQQSERSSPAEAGNPESMMPTTILVLTINPLVPVKTTILPSKTLR
jgi:hypothetical protein